jgi:FkbM family methyltransferase
MLAMNAIGKQVLRNLGYEVTRTSNVGVDVFQDMRRFLGNSERFVIFDIGANEGNMARQFRKHFAGAEIHCFEPNPPTFHVLRETTASDASIKIWDHGMAAARSRQVLYENENSLLNSFLPLGNYESGGRVINHTEVELETVDHFCHQHGINKIGILKSDTEGYDLEVLKGARAMLETGSVRLVYFEVNFAEKYVGQGSFGQQFDLLQSCGFRFVSFYQIFRENDVATWTDALFVHSSVI